MNSERLRIIELIEYETKKLPLSYISEEEGRLIRQNYSSEISLKDPSIFDNQWVLTSSGWIGHIPVNPELRLVLKPKVSIENIFGMLEYAYRFKGFKILDGLTDCDSLEEFYERLAIILALRALDRARKGVYRAYLPDSGRLPFVRGRLDVRKSCERPWEAQLNCHYEEHTSDVEENQILAWTFQRIIQSGICTERSLPHLRRAYRAFQSFASPRPCTSQECIGRLYNRLNQDYEPMHALCRFFLEQSGPGHQVGEKTMLPFLVDMAHLYELFVAEWLKDHEDLFPPGLFLESHVKVEIGRRIHFDIDLVIYEKDSQKALFVLDTKYKAPEHPGNDDISQVVTYATAKGCHGAILIYPKPQNLDERIGNIRVRSLTFSLDGDLGQAGNRFLKDLFQCVDL